MEWYYSRKPGEQAGPVSEEQILEWIRTRHLKPRHLLWNETLAEWTAIRDLPEFASTPSEMPEHQGDGSVSASVGLPKAMTGTVKANAILLILLGIGLLCFMGLGVLLILAGITLFSFSRHLQEIHYIDPVLSRLLGRLNLFFRFILLFFILIAAIAGIFAIASLIG